MYEDRRPWIEAVVLATLAVNRYSLARVLELRPQLEIGGILDGEVRGVEPIADTLEQAGYTRGDFILGLVAQRLEAFFFAADGGLVAELVLQEEDGNRRAILELLESVKGVGPTVASNAYALRSSSDTDIK